MRYILHGKALERVGHTAIGSSIINLKLITPLELITPVVISYCYHGGGSGEKRSSIV